MSFFVKVYYNFTSVLLCTHSWLVVTKSDFELVGCGTNILDITFVAGDQVNYVLRFTIKLLSDRIAPPCSSARKIIWLNWKISTEIAFPFAFKATLSFSVIEIGAARACKNFFYVFGSSKRGNGRSLRENFG